MRDRLDCAAEPSSVRAARLFVVDKLQEWNCDDLVDSAALVTSELATNALVHTGQPYSVQVERNAGGVRVEVLDAGSELPRMRELIDVRDGVEPDDDRGVLTPDLDRLFSGLRIVDSVATEWGSRVVPGNG
ncbi:MAG: ATP-binding protein, partial [Acidimicrobiales bacterium]